MEKLSIQGVLIAGLLALLLLLAFETLSFRHAEIAGPRAPGPGPGPAVRPADHDPDDESPEAAGWRRFNERCASDSLKTLTSAEADFVANEREGFYTMTATVEQR